MFIIGSWPTAWHPIIETCKLVCLRTFICCRLTQMMSEPLPGPRLVWCLRVLTEVETVERDWHRVSWWHYRMLLTGHSSWSSLTTAPRTWTWRRRSSGSSRRGRLRCSLCWPPPMRAGSMVQICLPMVGWEKFFWLTRLEQTVFWEMFRLSRRPIVSEYVSDVLQWTSDSYCHYAMSMLLTLHYFISWAFNLRKYDNASISSYLFRLNKPFNASYHVNSY